MESASGNNRGTGDGKVIHARSADVSLTVDSAIKVNDGDVSARPRTMRKEALRKALLAAGPEYCHSITLPGVSDADSESDGQEELQVHSDSMMPTRYYDPDKFICTSNGNVVSRSCTLCGAQNIHLHGKTIISNGVIIRGDFTNIWIGRHCVLGQGVVLRSSCKMFKGGFAYIPLRIGESTLIGNGTVIEGASIGANVVIGKNCVIGARCIIRDCCQVADNSILAPDTVLSPFSLYAGIPAQCVGELPGSTPQQVKEKARDIYRHFLPRPRT